MSRVDVKSAFNACGKFFLPLESNIRDEYNRAIILPSIFVAVYYFYLLTDLR